MNSCTSFQCKFDAEYHLIDDVPPSPYKRAFQLSGNWRKELMPLWEKRDAVTNQLICKFAGMEECDLDGANLFKSFSATSECYISDVLSTLQVWDVIPRKSKQEGIATSSQSEIERVFTELTNTWRKETRLSSSVTTKAMNHAYQRIIGMGMKVVPFILKDLLNQPDHWFWALSAITGDNPVNPEDAGNIEKMRDAWLDYGKRKGYL